MSGEQISSRSEAIIHDVFFRYFTEGATTVPFERDDLAESAERQGLSRPKNLGEPIYQYRYVKPMPPAVAEMAPPGKEWVIRGRGAAKYAFEAVELAWFTPREDLPEVQIPNATPRLVEQHSLADEQALLSRVRHAGLVSLATGVVAQHLQSHLRSTVSSGQVEIDDLYVGIDDRGQHYAIPIEAKAGSGRVSLIQVEQATEFCLARKQDAVCIPLGIQLLPDESIYFFVFERVKPWETSIPRLTLERELRFRLT
jgi:hypothetical protein